MAAERMREIKISVPEELFSLFLPPEAQDHLVQAKKEMLLAIRAFVEARIEMLDKKQARKAEPKRKIKIE
jgi:hypothetical protein